MLLDDANTGSPSVPSRQALVLTAVGLQKQPAPTKGIREQKAIRLVRARAYLDKISTAAADAINYFEKDPILTIL
jgi:hypothetical protein